MSILLFDTPCCGLGGDRRRKVPRPPRVFQPRATGTTKKYFSANKRDMTDAALRGIFEKMFSNLVQSIARWYNKEQCGGVDDGCEKVVEFEVIF